MQDAGPTALSGSQWGNAEEQSSKSQVLDDKTHTANCTSCKDTQISIQPKNAFQQESRVFFFHEKSQWFLVSKWVVLRSPRVVLSPRTSPRVAPIPFVGTGAAGIQVGTCVDRVGKC